MQQAIDIIRNSAILTAEDLQSIGNIKEELLDTFRTVQIFRTRTEMEVSVLQDLKHPTPDSKYWQCQREQNVHFQELVMLSYEYRKNQIEIKKLERDIAKKEDELDRELDFIEVERKKFIAINQERTAHDRIREITEWSKIKAELKPYMQHGTDDVDRHQLGSYALAFLNQVGNAQNAPPADRQNIYGKAQTALRRCEELGIKVDHPVLQAMEAQKCLPTA